MADNKNKKSFLGNNNMMKVPKFNTYWIFGVLGVVFLAFQFLNIGQSPKDTTWYTVKQRMIQNNQVEKIEVVRNIGQINIYLKDEALSEYPDLFKGMEAPSKKGPHYKFNIGSIETFEKNLDIIQQTKSESEIITVKYIDKDDVFGKLFWNFFPFILLIGLWFFVFKKMNKGGAGGGAGGIFSVGKSKAKIYDKDSDMKITFADVAGLSEAKEEIEEIVQFLKFPERYEKLGGKIPKGALLVGPPGTGKTLLAKAVAGEAQVPFFSMSGSDFVEMFVGVGASRVRDLFKQAKEKSPCIIFIDEIDAIGKARGKNPNMGSNDERENTLNQLLTEMDGFDTNSRVIILAATNRADILDKALLRAGRFDRQIEVDLPDLNERVDIFKVHLKPLTLIENLDTEFLAKQTPGFSGADIANVCNESALIAARHKKTAIEKQDFLDAIDRIVGGLEKKNKIISVNEKKTIAYHEAGHATTSWLLEHAHPLIKVTIIPRGKALGAAWYLPEERSIVTKAQMLDEMCSTLAGRAAEELCFNMISTGAQNDLEKVTKQAMAMISIYGMSEKLGNISYYDSSGQSDYSFSKPYSEKTAELIDQEVKVLIDESYQRALQLLRDNAENHKKLAELLLEKEVIFSEDLERIFGKRKFDKSEPSEE